MTYLAHTYGGRRAWLRHLRWRTALAAGQLNGYAAIDWARVERVVFVCMGNICRSAYAQGRARALGLAADSFGLDTTPGRPADTAARHCAAARGLDLEAHRTRVAGEVPCGPNDLIAVMEPGQAERLGLHHGGAQITLLGLWARPPRPYLHDPYGLEAPYFDRCFDTIDRAIDTLRPRLPRPTSGAGADAGITPPAQPGATR